jgi:hypothetical protein
VGPWDEYDPDKVAEAAFALMWFAMEWDKHGIRAWKGMAWDVLDLLYERGLISNPKSKAKSVGIDEEGKRLAEELARKLFGRTPEGAPPEAPGATE